MTKEQRLAYIRTRFTSLNKKHGELPTDVVLAVGKHDIKEEIEIGMSDTFREHQRDIKEFITSDEV